MNLTCVEETSTKPVLKVEDGCTSLTTSQSQDADFPVTMSNVSHAKTIRCLVEKRRLLPKKHQPVIKPRLTKKCSEILPTTSNSVSKAESPEVLDLASPKCKRCSDGVMEYDSNIRQAYCLSCCTVDESINFAIQYDKQMKFVSAGKDAPFNPGRLPVMLLGSSGKRKPAGHRQVLEQIDRVAYQYNMKPDSVRNIKDKFDNMYPGIKNKTIKFKEAVAVCCLYRELIQCKAPVLLRELLLTIDCQQKDYFKAMKLVDTMFGKTGAPEKQGMVRAILKHADQAGIKGEDLQSLMQKTEKILSLAERCWLCSGRSTSALTIACAYLAYKAHLIRSRDMKWKKVSFEIFCDRFKIIDQCSTASQRLHELRLLFFKLGHSHLNLMYNGVGIARREIELHIDDILLFSDEIIDEFVSLENKEMEEKKVLVSTFRRQKKKFPNYPEEGGVSDGEAAFLSSLPLEDVIPNSEMHEYIRDADEVKCIKRLRKIPDFPILDEEGKSYLYRDLPGYEDKANRDELQAYLLMKSSDRKHKFSCIQVSKTNCSKQ